MTMLRTLLVDDEPLAIERLQFLLTDIASAEVVGTATNGREASEQIDALKPDLVFLDVQMPEQNGLRVASTLESENRPEIIFVTAFDEFAVQAFDSAVADYLLKPVERDRLMRALDRVQRRHKLLDAEQKVDELHQIVRALRAARQSEHAGAYESEFWLKSSGGLVRVPVDTIESVSSASASMATMAGRSVSNGAAPPKYEAASARQISRASAAPDG